MFRCLLVLVFLVVASVGAMAGSTVNPNTPTAGSDLTSAPVRGNFAAAYSDINNILGSYPGASSPTNPTIGQFWRRTNVSPQIIFQWSGTSWLPYSTFDTANSRVTPIFGNSVLAWQQLLTGSGGLGSAGQCIVSTGLATVPIASSCLTSANLANPTALVGLSPINGVASTAMRSDGAPALDQSIAPTMTGLWNFSNTTDSTTTATGSVKLAGGLGVAKGVNALTFNGLTITPSTGTLTIASGKTAVISNTLSFSGTDSTSFVFPSASDTVAGIAASQILTNKTINTASNSISIASVAVTANTGTGAMARAVSPLFTTPDIGAATATSINGLTVTTTTGTLTVANGKIFTASNSLTFTGTDSTSFAFPSSSDTVVTLAVSQSLSNKTLLSPVLSGTVTGVGTVPNSVLVNSSLTIGSTSVSLGATAATLSGLTLASPTFSGTVAGAGTVPNSVLVNSATTVNGTVCTLGSTCTPPAPAGTLTGTTLASNVVTSSLTSVGTLTGGVWNATSVSLLHGGTGQTTAAAARACSGLNIDCQISTGDANVTIATTTRQQVTSATLTAARTWTLPAASAVNAGQTLMVIDAFGGINGANTITLQRAGSDTISGNTSQTMATQYQYVILASDGVSKWTVAASGGGGGGGVSSITAGNGLAGGTITTSGTFTNAYPHPFMLPL